MKTTRTILSAIVLIAALTGLLIVGLATAGTAWETDQPASPAGDVIAYDIGQGGAHCDATNGNHWAWDPRVSPGSVANGLEVSAPGWTEQNRSVNAQDKLILHYVRTDYVDVSQPQTLIIDGTSYTVPVEYHESDKCPGEVPPPETCETNQDLCPPIPELVTVCRDGQMIEIPKSEVLPTDTEECDVPEVPVTPEVPKVPVLVPPTVVTAPPVAVPTTPTVDTPKELAFTGAAETGGLAAIGTGILIAGLFMVRGRKTQRGLVR